MKTLREILLERHRGVEPKLDRISAEVVATEADRLKVAQTSESAVSQVSNLRPLTTPSAPPGFNRLPTGSRRYSRLGGLRYMALRVWQELILPSRRIWAGLAAVWVVLVVINAGQSKSAPGSNTVAASAKPEVMQAIAEQKRLLAELLQAGNPQPAERPRAAGRPRTQGVAQWRAC